MLFSEAQAECFREVHMIVKITSASAQKNHSMITLRCPACLHKGTFNAYDVPDIHAPVRQGDDTYATYVFGQRRCPNRLRERRKAGRGLPRL